MTKNKNFYDAVLIGTELPTLLAAGLLGKRGFRVLLVGQGQPMPTYTALGHVLPRRPFTLTAEGSPAITRVFHELALRPLMRRRIAPLQPSFQIVMPRHRLDFSANPEQIAFEIEREFPSVRRAADDFLRSTARTWDAVNRLLEPDLMWPPSSFLERREHARASTHHPLGRDEHGPPPLAELADDHPLRQSMNTMLRFTDGSDLGEGNPQRLLRLVGASLRSAALREGGYGGLFELLVESIRTHNGEVRFTDRVERILVRRGKADGVVLSPSDEEIGCHFVINGLPVARAARLLSDRSGLDALLDELGAPRPHFARFTLNMVVHRDALPEGMARNVLLLSQRGAADFSERAIWVESERIEGSELAIITAETLLPASPPEARSVALSDLRERMLSALERLCPFLRRHLVLLDSPHDGRDVYDARAQTYSAPTDAWTRGPDTMPITHTYARTRLHGITALSVRTPIKRFLLCSDQVAPGLALEGAFLTAWSAARVVTRTLNRDWMNRGRWTKVDL